MSVPAIFVPRYDTKALASYSEWVGDVPAVRERELRQRAAIADASGNSACGDSALPPAAAVGSEQLQPSGGYAQAASLPQTATSVGGTAADATTETVMSHTASEPEAGPGVSHHRLKDSVAVSSALAASSASHWQAEPASYLAALKVSLRVQGVLSSCINDASEATPIIRVAVLDVCSVRVSWYCAK